MPDKLHLKFAGLQGRTLEAYGKALQHFLCYLTRERIRIRSVSNLDSHLSEYINILYQEGEALSVAGHLLSAIKRFIPEFKLRLPAASQFHRNWQRLHVPVRATPIPVELLEGLAALCLSIDEPALAILLILGFRCFLRTNEMLHLQWNHLLVLPGQQCINLILPFSKTSQGNPQVLRVEDPLVLQLLQRFRPAADSPAMLWPLSLRKFHRTWKQLLRCLGFSSTSFSPYGIRRGGATYFFLTCGNIDTTVARGRWANARVARIYIDDGALALAEMRWTQPQKKAVRKWAKRLHHFYSPLRKVRGKRSINGLRGCALVCTCSYGDLSLVLFTGTFPCFPVFLLLGINVCTCSYGDLSLVLFTGTFPCFPVFLLLGINGGSLPPFVWGPYPLFSWVFTPGPYLCKGIFILVRLVTNLGCVNVNGGLDSVVQFESWAFASHLLAVV